MEVKNKAIKHIGILGGMGPFATVAFLEQVLRLAQELYGAKQDSDFPQISLESVPLPQLSAFSFTDKEAAVNILTTQIAQLSNQGCEVIAIPCNTVHAFHKELQASTSIPVLNIITETVSKARELGVKKAYVIATNSTMEEDLYTNALTAHSIQTVQPSTEAQKYAEDLITELEQGRVSQKALALSALLEAEAESMGADCNILGCTELTLVSSTISSHLLVLDSSQILANALVSYAYEAVIQKIDE
jgi:aspartate racemase